MFNVNSMARASIGLAVIFFALTSIQSGKLKETATANVAPQAVADREPVGQMCNRLIEVRKLPFKGERIDDPVYNELIAYGEEVVPCLIEKISDTTPMKDPRQAPSAPDFRVGDLAFFLLSDITNTSLQEVLPEEVVARMDERGIYAYFDYVQREKNRKVIQDLWRAKWQILKARGETGSSSGMCSQRSRGSPAGQNAQLVDRTVGMPRADLVHHTVCAFFGLS